MHHLHQRNVISKSQMLAATPKKSYLSPEGGGGKYGQRSFSASGLMMGAKGRETASFLERDKISGFGSFGNFHKSSGSLGTHLLYNSNNCSGKIANVNQPNSSLR